MKIPDFNRRLMPDIEKQKNGDPGDLIKKIDSLEERILKIESLLREGNYSPADMAHREGDVRTHRTSVSPGPDSSLESGVMEFGLGWLSNIVYLLGIIFLMVYIRNSGHPVIASIIGYGAAASIFLLSNFIRKSFPHMVYVLSISGLLLLYYVTLRLYFFDHQPIINSEALSLILVLLINGLQIYYAIKKKSEFFGLVTITLLLITALVADSAYITMSIIFLNCLVLIYFFIKFEWWRLLISGMFLVYCAHLLWFLSNPLMGHPIQAMPGNHNSLIYLFLYVAAFSTIILLPRKKAVSNGLYGLITISNSLFFIFLVILEVLTYYEHNYVWIFGIISILNLVFSALLKYRTDKPFAPAFFACFGFLSLSMALYGYSGFPHAYLLLAIQSLLVVSMALWYRSKIIVIVNTFLFVIILATYLSTSSYVNSINFSFAIIALATARIMNWQRARLTLKTDFLRVIFLIAGFIMVLFALNKAVPAQFVTLSWMLAAVFYLIMSILLKNIRYRTMSIFTILFTGLHLLVVDMAQMDIGYRVIAFMFFAVITLGISLYYTKWLKKKSGIKNSSGPN